ncbi:hypothetical protein OSTOST_18712 [Ostertagia ostertagi]
MIYSHTQLKGKNKLMLALLKAIEKRGMHLVTPLINNLREIGNMFHTDEVCNQARQLLLQNSRVKYRKFLNKASSPHYIISPGVDSNQYLSVVKITVNRDSFTQALTQENLINSLVSKFSECGIKSNGIRSQLRVTLLVNVIQLTAYTEPKNSFRGSIGGTSRAVGL